MMKGTREKNVLALDSFDSTPHLTRDFALFGATFNILALIVFLLTARQRQFHLQTTRNKIELQWDEGGITVTNLAHEGINLPAVEQQFTSTARTVISPMPHGILRNVQPAQPDFPFIDGRVGVNQRSLALPQRFDLCANQNHTAFVGIEDVVIVGLTVGSNDLPTHRTLAFWVAFPLDFPESTGVLFFAAITANTLAQGHSAKKN